MFNVLGTDPERIDSAEDRHKFSAILDQHNIDQPEWVEVTTVDAPRTSLNELATPFLSDLLMSYLVQAMNVRP